MSDCSEVIHIACGADTNYLPHCAAMLNSLLSHHPSANIHFLYGSEISPEDFAPLAEMVTALGGKFCAHFINKGQIEGLQRMARIPPLMWYRIYLPELLPGLKQILYLDCDTLVCDSLMPLWQMNLEDYYVAAVTNVLESDVQHWPSKLGLPENIAYFNSGVLLFNLEAMRAASMPKKLAAFGRNPAQSLRWPDQDALNILLADRRLALHPRWNCQNSLYYLRESKQYFSRNQRREAMRTPAILHFEGPSLAKPWNYLNRHPFRHLYFKHRASTPWPEVEITGRRPATILLRLLPTRWTIILLKSYARLRDWLR